MAPAAGPTDVTLAKAFGKRKPKTRKGRKILQSREPQVVEDAKTALIVRGNRGSQEVMNLLRDLHRLRTPLSALFGRKHEYHPFEDVQRLEGLCKKFDHSLFAYGSSSKKRPFRLILGRLFDGVLLDMQEFEVEDYTRIDHFTGTKKDSVIGAKPLIIFQGPAFETDDRLKRVKSLLMDFFGGAAPDKVLLDGLEHVIVCTAGDTALAAAAATSTSPAVPAVPLVATGEAAAPKVSVRRFHLQFLKSGSKLPRIELQEVGPRFRLVLDRVKEPDRERWKQAIKVPKAAKPKKVKNITTDSLGKKRGRIHLGRQDFDRIHTVHHGKAKEKKLRVELAKKKSGGGGTH